MSYDYSRLLTVILEATSAKGAFTDRMMRVIDECEQQRPHPDWAHFRRISYDEEVARLSSWLGNAFGQDWGPSSCKGIWIGLVQVECDGEVVADMYASGSSLFSTESIEWAYDVQANGAAAYLDSTVLAGIYKQAYGSPSGLGNAAEYPLVLAYGAMVTSAALETDALAKLRLSPQGAAAGYDGGDFLFLGTFEGGRFVSNPRVG